MSSAWKSSDGRGRDSEVDAPTIRVDRGDLLEADHPEAVPEQDSALDHDLVRMIGVPPVADVFDLADVTTVECDHAEALGVRQASTELQDVFAVALRFRPLRRQGSRRLHRYLA